MNKLAASVLLVSVATGLGAGILFSGNHVKTDSMLMNVNGTAVNQSANTTKQLGIVANRRLSYGVIPVGSSATKFLKVKAPVKSLMALRSSGNISGQLRHPESIYFKGERSIAVEFNASEPGYYEGKLSLKTWVPRDRVGRYWVSLRSRLQQYL